METTCPARRRAEREAEKAARKAENEAKHEDWKKRQERGPMCHFCAVFGHLAKDCPARRDSVYLECGRAGHTQRACPTLHPLKAAPQSRGKDVVDEDARSVSSAASASTAASTAAGAVSIAEEREAKRLEK